MTTVITPFLPVATSSPPFSFSASLDGTTYSVECRWNVYRQDYFVHVYDQYGALVICHPMIGSPNGFDVNLAPGIFSQSSLVFRAPSQQFEATDGAVSA